MPPLTHDNNEPPDWFNPIYSKKLSLPDFQSKNFVTEDVNINFGLKNHNDTYNTHYVFTNPIKKLAFGELPTKNNEKIIKKINDEKEKGMKKAKSNSAKLGIRTKHDNKIQIYPTDKQKKIIKIVDG
jgi:hypothetical protein